MNRKTKIFFLLTIIIIFLCISLVCFTNFKEEKQEVASMNVINDNRNEYVTNNKENNEAENLINITECSEDFMEEYFEESKEIKEEKNKENILIITSKEKIENTYGASSIIEAPNNQYILQYDSKDEKEKALQEFQKSEENITVEENIIHTFTDYNSWGIEKIGLSYATQIANEKNLNEITVAIIDSGCEVEWINNKYPGKIIETYDVLNPDSEMNDIVGHGTHIAGTIAEGTPDNVKILPIKVSNGKDIYTTDIIEAINYIVYYDKADVINMSFGAYGASIAEYQAIESAKQENIISVAAAGNDNVSYEHYPAAFNNTISISSVDSNLNKSTFSNYGSTITFTAPGTDILSINGIKSGTSMATPHAVSAVALLKSYNENITLENTVDLLKRYAIDLGEEGFDEYFGYGLINFNGVEFFDGTNGDEFKIFKNYIKAEVAETITPTYNYGNITNLMNANIKFYYDESNYYTKQLWELEDVQITGYNPYSYTEQNVTIKYNNEEIILKVDNRYATTCGYEYIGVGNNNISLRTIRYVDSIPLKIYIPQELDGYIVSKLEYGLLKDLPLKSVVIPTGVTTIDGAFSGCSELESVSLPEGLLEIGNYAFFGTQQLKNIQIPNTVTSIGVAAFSSSGITSIKIPSSVKKIDIDAFYNCILLKEVTLSEGLEEIGNFAFECTNLNEISIPKSVTKLGTNPFYRVYSLINIIVDKNNEMYSSFNNNSIVEKENNALITSTDNTSIPKTVKIIDNCAFSGYFDELIIPEGVEEIREYVIGGCNYSIFNKVVLPKSLTTISANAFKVLESTSYKIPENLVIWLYKNTYAQTYAEKNNLKYEYIEDIPDNTYKGNINSELITFNVGKNDVGATYVSGQIVVVEWVNGVSTVPKVAPKMRFKSTDGIVNMEVFVTPTGTNTYYFDRYIEGIDTSKEYFFEIESGDENNISEYRSMNVYFTQTKYNDTIVGKYHDKKIRLLKQKILFEDDTYVGNINSELITFNVGKNDTGATYVSGQVVVVEWVNGVSTVPEVAPKMRFKSTDGTVNIEVFVTPTGTNTYYFDRFIEGINTNKQYFFEIESGDSRNVSENRSMNVYFTKTKYNDTIVGKYRDKKIRLLKQNIIFEEDTYVGNINSELITFNVGKNDAGATYVSGQVVVVEWVDGKSTVPEVAPKMKFKSTDGTVELEVFVTPTGTNTYYFDRFIEGIDTSKEYYFEIESGDSRNVSPNKSMNVYFTKTKYNNTIVGIYHDKQIRLLKQNIIFENLP